MLGIIAPVLIVLWLLGFFAFHVSSGLVHIALVGLSWLGFSSGWSTASYRWRDQLSRS